MCVMASQTHLFSVIMPKQVANQVMMRDKNRKLTHIRGADKRDHTHKKNILPHSKHFIILLHW